MGRALLVSVTVTIHGHLNPLPAPWLLSSLHPTCMALSPITMHAEEGIKTYHKLQPGVHSPSGEEAPDSKPLVAGST